MFEQLEEFVRRVMSNMETTEDAKLFLKILEGQIRKEHNVSVEQFLMILEGIVNADLDKDLIEEIVLEKIRLIIAQLKFVIVVANED